MRDHRSKIIRPRYQVSGIYAPLSQPTGHKNIRDTGPKWFVHAISHPEFMHPYLIRQDTRVLETTGPKWFVHAISHPELMHPCLIRQDTRILETTGPKWFVHAIRRPEFMHPCPIRLGVKSRSLYLRSDCSYLHFVGTGTVNLRIVENSAFPYFSASSITVTFSSDLYSPTVCYYVQQEPICIA